MKLVSRWLFLACMQLTGRVLLLLLIRTALGDRGREFSAEYADAEAADELQDYAGDYAGEQRQRSWRSVAEEQEGSGTQSQDVLASVLANIPPAQISGRVKGDLAELARDLSEDAATASGGEPGGSESFAEVGSSLRSDDGSSDDQWLRRSTKSGRDRFRSRRFARSARGRQRAASFAALQRQRRLAVRSGGQFEARRHERARRIAERADDFEDDGDVADGDDDAGRAEPVLAPRPPHASVPELRVDSEAELQSRPMLQGDVFPDEEIAADAGLLQTAAKGVADAQSTAITDAKDTFKSIGDYKQAISNLHAPLGAMSSKASELRQRVMDTLQKDEDLRLSDLKALSQEIDASKAS